MIEPYIVDTECQTRMHPISCALLQGSGLAHATCHPRTSLFKWLNTLSNEEQRNRTKIDILAKIIQTRSWRWLGHVCRMSSYSITGITLRCTPQGKRKRGRPRETWRCTVEKDLNIRGLSLVMAPEAAADRARLRKLAVASRARRCREDEWVSEIAKRRRKTTQQIIF